MRSVNNTIMKSVVMAANTTRFTSSRPAHTQGSAGVRALHHTHWSGCACIRALLSRLLHVCVCVCVLIASSAQHNQFHSRVGRRVRMRPLCVATTAAAVCLCWLLGVPNTTSCTSEWALLDCVDFMLLNAWQ